MHINGLDFHVVDEGNGPVVLMLHGFPDSSYLWRNQIQPLVRAGYRVIAPDLRGFGESDKPQEVESYKMQFLASDVIWILKELQVESVYLVAHDWGAGLAWTIAALYPDLIKKFVPVSVGHPNVNTNIQIEQCEKSWYVFMFQAQHDAEEFLTRNDWQVFRQWNRMHNEQEKWISELSRPGALTAGLNWYRANSSMKTFLKEIVLPKVKAPTLGIWSSFDDFLTEPPMIKSRDYVEGPWNYVRLDCSHWVPLDQPDVLNKLLLDFFKD